MKIIAVDDELIAKEGLIRSIKKCVESAEVYGFDDAYEALAFSEENPCDIAFLDIEMRRMNGLELALKMKIKNPKINIVFTTGYSEYMADAFAMQASGYITKPITPEKIQKEIDNLRYPVEMEKNKSISIQTFGNFEVFIDGVPARFQYAKTKELLAFLVDRRGAFCTNNEIMAAIFEVDMSASYLRNLKNDLLTVLPPAIFNKKRGEMAIYPREISCDYFDWLNGKISAINLYRGEYMAQYSWGEVTLAGMYQDEDSGF